MHTSFNNFIESTSKTLEHHTENPNDKYEVRPCDEPGTPFAVWEGDLRVKCFKTEEEAQAYADSENEKQGLDEGTMSDIHQLAGEVKDLAEFTKEFFKRFGDKIKKTADSVEWVKTLYSDMANESIDEISQNEGIFDRFRKRSIKGTVDKEPYYFDIADKALLYLQKQDKEWRKYKLSSVGPGDKKTHIRMALSHKTNHKTADPEFMVYHDKNDNIEKVVELSIAETIDENAIGINDRRLDDKQKSALDLAVRGDSAYSFGNDPYADDQLRYKYAVKMGFLEEKKEIKEEDPGKADMLASAIQKALNKHKGDESKTYQLQQARKAMNKGDLSKAEKIAKRLAEKLKSK